LRVIRGGRPLIQAVFDNDLVTVCVLLESNDAS
jgi:hypothetical protein